MPATQKTVDLVTGGAGFLGSHLVDELLERGRNVVVVDNMDAGHATNLEPDRPGLRVLQADTREVGWWRELQGVRVSRVFHLAANASVPRSSEDPQYDLTTNILGTLNLLTFAVQHSASFVYVSSAAVYGTPQYVPTDEAHPTLPISYYGTSKLAGEHYVDLFRREQSLDTRIIRYFNCFGPRQPRYIVFDFLRKILADGDTFEVLGTGEQIRTQLYVRDAISATLAVADRGDHLPYNIGSDRRFTVIELAETVLATTGRTDKTIVTTGKSWPGDIYTLRPDTKRLKSLGFSETVSLEQGLQEVYEWWLEHKA